MFTHVMLGSNEIERSRRFYDAVFAAIGGPPGVVDARGRLVYAHGGARLMLSRPLDGAPATAGNGATIGFAMESPEQARAWHEAGVASGGASVEDPPGVRRSPVGELFLAYLRDPDGNKLCALNRVAKG